MKKLRNFNLFFTSRGLILLIIVFYLYAFPVLVDDDIVASSFAAIILTLLILVSTITICYGLYIKQNLKIKFTPNTLQENLSEQGSHIFSNEKTVHLLKLFSPSIFPFFTLKIQSIFEHENPKSNKEFVILGKINSQREIHQEIVFPHRGEWGIEQFQLVFSDVFGFTALRWKDTPEQLISFVVGIKYHKEGSTVPVFSSAYRAGDELIDIHNKQGDPFDLKQYHPSDGLKKVVWKIYAKTRSLISRHPEPSMTPEGTVVVFCHAEINEDFVCASALQYINKLESLNLEIYFNCLGNSTLPTAETCELATDMLIQSVWQINNTQEQGASDLKFLVKSFIEKNNNARLERVVIFISESFDSDYAKRVIKLGELLEENNIQPVFVVVKNSRIVHNNVDKKRFLYLFNQEDSAAQNIQARESSAFYNIAAQKKWEIVSD